MNKETRSSDNASISAQMAISGSTIKKPTLQYMLDWYADSFVLPVPPVPERNKDLERFFSPESLSEVAALIEDLDLEIVSIIPTQNA